MCVEMFSSVISNMLRETSGTNMVVPILKDFPYCYLEHASWKHLEQTSGKHIWNIVISNMLRENIWNRHLENTSGTSGTNMVVPILKDFPYWKTRCYRDTVPAYYSTAQLYMCVEMFSSVRDVFICYRSVTDVFPFLSTFISVNFQLSLQKTSWTNPEFWDVCFKCFHDRHPVQYVFICSRSKWVCVWKFISHWFILRRHLEIIWNNICNGSMVWWRPKLIGCLMKTSYQLWSSSVNFGWRTLISMRVESWKLIEMKVDRMSSEDEIIWNGHLEQTSGTNENHPKQKDFGEFAV